MKSTFIILVLLLCSKFIIAQSSDIEQLKQLNHDWISSYVTRDTAVMGKIFADDLILSSPNGTIFHKQDILKNLMSPGPQYLTAKVDTVSVRVFGDTGLVSAKSTVTFKGDGKVQSVQTCYLDVYEKRGGRWYVVASQVALLSGS